MKQKGSNGDRDQDVVSTAATAVKEKFQEDINNSQFIRTTLFREYLTHAKLEVSPTELKWEFEEGQHVITVANNTKARFAFKLKCTDNELYSVAPVMDFVDAGKVLNVAIVRFKGPFKKDKIVLCSKQVSQYEKNVEKSFEGGAQNIDVIQMEQRIRA
uniref:Major sperm protein n=1 Tax=Haemonchus contortus TaxID=6289 RepID=A0A7I5EB14_HAECO